jgi:ATP-binding cassette subfamily B protein
MADSPLSTRRAIRFLASHLRRHALSLGGGFVVLVGVDLVQLLIPHLIQRTLDRLSNAVYDGAFILRNSLLILFMATGMAALRFLWRFLIVMPSRRIEERMRNDLFGHIERLSAPFYNRTKTGDLMALFINDLNAIRMATSMALIGLFDAVFMSVMSLAFMIAISPRLTLFTALPLPLIIILLIRTGRLIEARYTLVQESFSGISTHTQESFSGIRVIKGFAREAGELTRFRAACDEYVEHNMALTRIWGLIFPTITFLASLSFSLLLLFGGRLVLAEKLSIGQFVSFTFYINLLVWPMIATGWVFNLVQRGIASTKRVLEILDTRPEVAAGIPEAAKTIAAGHIEFRNLTFRYAEKSAPALNDIALDVPEGSSLGIIGKPGSGKTSLASLLFHLYPLDTGRLFIDGRDINDLSLDTLRRSIAYVPQDSFLFSDTIAANIAFGIEDQERKPGVIEEAARLAAVDRDIAKFTEGYETRIGERGVMLSGGQKQRLAIARAILTESARILILDDALSAVDTATEAEILANIRPIIRRKTTLMIAHRISTIRQCDTIVVLDNGRIAERGTHDELAAAGGFYATLYELQRMKGGAA